MRAPGGLAFLPILLALLAFAGCGGSRDSSTKQVTDHPRAALPAVPKWPDIEQLSNRTFTVGASRCRFGKAAPTGREINAECGDRWLGSPAVEITYDYWTSRKRMSRKPLECRWLTPPTPPYVTCEYWDGHTHFGVVGKTEKQTVARSIAVAKQLASVPGVRNRANDADPHYFDDSASSQPSDLTLDSTCSDYMDASDPAKAALIESIKPKLGITFGAATVPKYVDVLNIDCPQSPSKSIQTLLADLGYLE